MKAISRAIAFGLNLVQKMTVMPYKFLLIRENNKFKYVSVHLDFLIIQL